MKYTRNGTLQTDTRCTTAGEGGDGVSGCQKYGGGDKQPPGPPSRSLTPVICSTFILSLGPTINKRIIYLPRRSHRSDTTDEHGFKFVDTKIMPLKSRVNFTPIQGR